MSVKIRAILPVNPTINIQMTLKVVMLYVLIVLPYPEDLSFLREFLKRTLQKQNQKNYSLSEGYINVLLVKLP